MIKEFRLLKFKAHFYKSILIMFQFQQYHTLNQQHNHNHNNTHTQTNSEPFKRKINLIKSKIAAIQKILTQQSFSHYQINRQICEVFSDVVGIRIQMSKHKYDTKGLIEKLIKKTLKKSHGLDQLIFDLQAKQEKLKNQFDTACPSQPQQQEPSKNQKKQQKQNKTYLKLQESLQVSQKNQKTLQELRTTIREVQILKKIKAKKEAIREKDLSNNNNNNDVNDKFSERFNSTLKTYLEREMLSTIIFRSEKVKF